MNHSVKFITSEQARNVSQNIIIYLGLIVYADFFSNTNMM